LPCLTLPSSPTLLIIAHYSNYFMDTTTMFVVKLQYQSEIRRVAVVDPIKYDRLKQLAHELFSTTSLPETFLFQYKDSEGDDVSVSSERELEEAIRIVQNNNPAILKLEIKSQQKNSDECCVQKFFENCRERRNQCGQQSGRCCSKKFFLIPLIVLLLVFKPCLGLILLAVGGICAVKRHFAFSTSDRINCDRRRRGSCRTQSSNGSQCPITSYCSSTVAPKSSDVNTVPKSEEVLNKETANTYFEGKQEQEQELEQEYEKVNSPFQSKLIQLEEMGFRDRTANIELLIKHGGNLLKSVKDLLEKNI